LKYTPLIPPFIDIDDLNMARSLLKDRVLYIKTPMWYNEKSEAIEGRKLIPVRVVDIRPGNNVLPVEVWFEDDKGNQAGVFMSLLSSSRSQYITFDRLFSFENPRLQVFTFPNVICSQASSCISLYCKRGFSKENKRSNVIYWERDEEGRM